MRIGLLSDTHLPDMIEVPWPEVAEAFRGVDLILHGGDILTVRCLDWLEEIAPVLAALGNNDTGLKDPRVKEVQILDVEGWRLGLIHDLDPEDRPIPYLVERYFKEPVDIMVSGHTHRERLDLRDGVLQVNPGSPTTPHLYSIRLGMVGILDVQRDKVTADIARLGEGPLVGDTPLVNPGREMHLEAHRNGSRLEA